MDRKLKSQAPALCPGGEPTGRFDNEKLFDHDGHFTAEGLDALCVGTLDELGGLEAAEHLTFCDACLARYTARMDALAQAGGLETPIADSCPEVTKELSRRRQNRRWLFVSNRSLTVAAGVLLAFGLWQAGAFGGRLPARLKPSDSAVPKTSISVGINSMFDSAQSGFRGLFDQVQANLQSGFAQLSNYNEKGK